MTYNKLDYVYIRCPHCAVAISRVADSRAHNGAIYRRRVCRGCKKNFITREEFISTESLEKAAQKERTNV